MLSRVSPLATKVAWSEQICTCQKFLVRHRNKICTRQKFLVCAVRATDFRRGAAMVALSDFALFGGTVATPYIGEAPIPRRVIYSCGARAWIGWRRWRHSCSWLIPGPFQR